MREGRRWRGRAREGACVAVLLALSACGTEPSAASPGATASMSVGATAAPSTPARSAGSPSTSPGAVCDPTLDYFVLVDSETAVPGTPVRVRINGFPPDTAVTLRLGSLDDGTAGRAIGAATTDGQGNGVVHGVVPVHAPFGDTTLRVMVNEGCGGQTLLAIVGSPEAISIDDDTVVAGQQVTIKASGFAAEGPVALYLDGDARDALCRCRSLAEAQANAVGFVEIVVRIPPDVSPGAHFLTLNGDSFDFMHDVGLTVHITVDPKPGP
jgi:hypothetical protein